MTKFEFQVVCMLHPKLGVFAKLSKYSFFVAVFIAVCAGAYIVVDPKMLF